MTQDAVSTQTLIKSSAAAAVIAGVVLICIILPAEYNIDPTTIGTKLGLTVLANTTELNSNETDVSTTEVNQTQTAQSKQVISIEVPAGKGLEYKFYMSQHEKMQYEWLTDGAELYFDLHGEPEGDTTGYFESYTIATSNDMKGSFTAPFNGSHGWYWKNSSDKPIFIRLTVEGQFKVIGLK